MHTPYLHRAATTVGVEVDISAVRRIIGVVAYAGGCGKPRLRTTVHRDAPDITSARMRASKGDGLSIGRPAMKIRGRILSDRTRATAAGWNDINARTGCTGCIATDGNPLTVRRQAMTAVASSCCANIDWHRRTAISRDCHDAAALIEDQRLAIACPVGRFEVTRRGIGDDGAGCVMI